MVFEKNKEIELQERGYYELLSERSIREQEQKRMQENRHKSMYKVGLGLIITTGIVSLFSCSGCVSPETKAARRADPYSHIDRDQRSKVEPSGSPYSDRKEVPLWLPPF
ncbi:hypothetical protein HYZ97_05145 [Candidatus Pacearchaeota archaeon]|nr:hypothetical protein [Candidatus Pacearchaeota archaeon]